MSRSNRSASPFGFAISRQPTDTSCGPTCLHAIYHHIGDQLPLRQVIDETHELTAGGGTLNVFLANHALRRGHRVSIYTYNLDLFDPSWFTAEGVDLAERLRTQARIKRHDEKLQLVTRGYLEFLERGGQLKFEDLTSQLLHRFLDRGQPLLTGLSATYLYRQVREDAANNVEDDVAGSPVGHFVVLCGYDRESDTLQVADPYRHNPMDEGHYYAVRSERLIGAILLGIVTHDANLLVIE